MKELLNKLKTYRFPLLILLLGVALMLLPSASARAPTEKENLGGAPYVRINGTEIMSQASPEKLLARIGELLMGAA